MRVRRRGDGRVLAETRNDVFSSDLYDRRYGEAGLDFLSTERSAQNIITNPQFHSAEGFVSTGLEHARGKLDLLLRLAFLESGHRNRTIFDRCPPSRV